MPAKRELASAERTKMGIGCAILLGIFALALIGSMQSAMCRTTIYAQSRSPAGSAQARVQMTDCGAVSGFSRVVWVQPSWLPTSRLFACRAVALNGKPEVTLRWNGGDLVIDSTATPEDIIAVAPSCQGWNVKVRPAAS